MFANVCSVCRSSKVVEGYKETTLIRTVRNEEKTRTKKWCQDCLTEYASKQERRASYMPKLRDTKIDKYLEVVNAFNFIPYAYKWKTNPYHHYDRAVKVE